MSEEQPDQAPAQGSAGEEGPGPASESPGYPAHWEADVLLRDGHTAHLRPVRPEDAELLREFYSRVSDESKYYRFFAPMPTLSARDVTRFTTVDHHDRVALVLTVADRMIAIGRYDSLGHGQAEVAFLVEDAHQRRGIAQLLLEHLAQAGRERGIEKFVAETLPANKKMIQVFADAGYHVSRGFEEGVVHLEFPIDPTDTAIGVMQDREHRAEAASIATFFNARSVAVIGASRRRDTIGQALVRHLVLGDYSGRVYAVNPTSESVAGLPSYDSVSDIPGEVDLAVIAVPADAVPDVVLDCAAKGVNGLVVISSGFAEAGPDGWARQRRMLGLARSYGLRVIGPNCLGIVNTDPEFNLNASLAPVMPQRGRVGFFSQSGALGTAILETASARGLGISTFVSAGNRADVSGNDLLQYWEEDPATEVILLYLESIGNPRKFSRISRRVSRHKPIVVVRSGRSTQGVPMGHAVRAIGAPQPAVDAMFKQAGVILVDSLDEMFDVAQLLAHQPLPRGSRVALVGNSDAIGLLAADAASANGLRVAKSVALGSEAGAEAYEDALDEAIDDEDVDAVVAIYIPPLDVSSEAVANVLASVGEQSDKPIVSTFLGARGVPELLRVPDLAGNVAGRGSVPSYSAVESAVRALARVVEYAAWVDKPEGGGTQIEDIDASTAKRMLGRILIASPEGRELGHEELAALLACYGIDVWDRIPVATLDEALDAGERLGWNVVLKGTAPRLRTRPDQAHLWRNIDDADEMAEAWEALTAMIDDPGTAGFVVQRMAAPGVPVDIGGVEDPLFGPTVSFSIAGALTDLVGDRAYRIPPITPLESAEMVREIRAAPLLFGFRGSPEVDVAALQDLLRRFAALKNDLPQLSAIDLGLVQVSEHGVCVLSVSGAVAPVPDVRSDWFTRRLNSHPGDTLPG
ncbi:GNAT family N-acetyltransferase [Marmoricola endophyticus]|uniref:GNAT family N-acetyltransferase n=1 Tax=Marmoricola endophyticus TaxID=2040280 RepID=A0A917F180_9ACTN|nr:bifunctional GNAT family N-acetyltransferase/acetate--CoA ligase family protein [Marmoricola endophyticus]GGF32625.1 GNAT family N-acetyltransferase [Marmoricola endophyticus]